MSTGKYKRISEIVPKNVSGPYDPLPIFGLASQESLFDREVVILGYETVEGEMGPYVHMLIESPNGDGPNGCKQYVLTTGAVAIMDRLGKAVEIAGKDAFPMVVKFTQNRTRNGKGIWYNVE